MATVGRTLAAERVRQRLNLDDIAALTKVNASTLKLIEADDFERLPGLLFARSFVGQYAECLRLDKAAIIQQFNREQTIPEAVFTAPPEREDRIRVPSLRPSSFTSVFNDNVISAFATFVLTIVVCAAAFYGYQYWRTRMAAARVSAAPVPAPAKRVEPVPPPAPETAVQPSVAEPAPVAAATELKSSAIADGGAHVRVELSANDACWARITVDGKVLFAGMLNAGETRLIQAASVVNLRAGNAGALSLKLNGSEVPPIGPKGQIRTVTLTTAGAQVLTPTPEPVSEPL